MLKVLIADDHAIIRKGLKQILLETYPFAVIHEARDAEEAIKMSFQNDFDVIISDLSMPGRSGLDLVEHFKQHFPKVPVLILSIHPEEQYAIRALRAGASGYLSKDAATDELVKAVQKVLQGRKYISPALAEQMAAELDIANNKNLHEVLSNREIHVFKLIAEGQSISDIAEKLSLSVTTVSTYRARIMHKMHMKTNAEITKYSIEFKLI
jgi:DNA-binding NarL/FixJ family response regulator